MFDEMGGSAVNGATGESIIIKEPSQTAGNGGYGGRIIIKKEKPMEKFLWWGYRHTNGEIIVKRFLSKEDLQEADASPFVLDRTDEFEAESREEALKIATEQL